MKPGAQRLRAISAETSDKIASLLISARHVIRASRREPEAISGDLGETIDRMEGALEEIMDHIFKSPKMEKIKEKEKE